MLWIKILFLAALALSHAPKVVKPKRLPALPALTLVCVITVEDGSTVERCVWQ